MNGFRCNLSGIGAGAGGGRGGAAPDSLSSHTAWAKRTFGHKADTLLKLYPAKDDAQAKQAYHDVYRDINFAGHRTWAKLRSITGKAPAWIYMFSHLPRRAWPRGRSTRPATGGDR